MRSAWRETASAAAVARLIRSTYQEDSGKAGQLIIEELEFKPVEQPIPEDLRASMDRARASLEEQWGREGAERELVYEIRLGEQTLTVYGREAAERVLGRLKALNIRGTYKIRTKNGNGR